MKLTTRQKDCIEVCSRRRSAGMNCHDCIYYKKTCDKIRECFKVNKPWQIKNHL